MLRTRPNLDTRRYPIGLVIGLGILVTITLVAALAPWVAPVDPNAQDLGNILASPSSEHWFGTDTLGRDMLSRVMYGSRFEIFMVMPAVLVALLIALPIGMSAGYLGGWVDRTISTASDTVLTFPSLVIAIVLVALMGTGTWPLLIAIVVTLTPQMIKYIRTFAGQTASLQFILAARAAGSSTPAIMMGHVSRNIGGPVLVITSLLASEAILITAALGFLGIGVQPPDPEWGTMLSEGRVDFMNSPHVMLFPGSAIALLILGFNLVGDGLRDYLDKRD